MRRVGMGMGGGWQISTPEKPAPRRAVARVWRGCDLPSTMRIIIIIITNYVIPAPVAEESM
jgi:hypothetical protein